MIFSNTDDGYKLCACSYSFTDTGISFLRRHCSVTICSKCVVANILGRFSLGEPIVMLTTGTFLLLGNEE